MAYQLKQDESVPDGLRRVAGKELKSAIKRLEEASERRRDEAVHEARKSVKKVRGLLRLVRPELGRVYRKENARLRDAGRGLSELRDAGAIIDSFDAVAEKHRRELRTALRGIRSGLVRRKKEHEREFEPGDVMQAAARKMQSCLERVPDWPLTHDGYRAISPGLKASYRAGRRAMAAALAGGSAADFHLWRRRAKDHWYHVRLLEPLWDAEIKAREADLHILETALGEDHNLVVLAEHLASDPEAFGGWKNVNVFTSLALHEQKELREKAIAVGKRLYAERTSQFEVHFEKLWNTWHAAGSGRDAAKGADAA